MSLNVKVAAISVATTVSIVCSCYYFFRAKRQSKEEEIPEKDKDEEGQQLEDCELHPGSPAPQPVKASVPMKGGRPGTERRRSYRDVLMQNAVSEAEIRILVSASSIASDEQDSLEDYDEEYEDDAVEDPSMNEQKTLKDIKEKAVLGRLTSERRMSYRDVLMENTTSEAEVRTIVSASTIDDPEESYGDEDYYEDDVMSNSPKMKDNLENQVETSVACEAEGRPSRQPTERRMSYRDVLMENFISEAEVRVLVSASTVDDEDDVYDDEEEYEDKVIEDSHIPVDRETEDPNKASKEENEDNQSRTIRARQFTERRLSYRDVLMENALSEAEVRLLLSPSSIDNQEQDDFGDYEDQDDYEDFEDQVSGESIDVEKKIENTIMAVTIENEDIEARVISAVKARHSSERRLSYRDILMENASSEAEVRLLLSPSSIVDQDDFEDDDYEEYEDEVLEDSPINVAHEVKKIESTLAEEAKSRAKELRQSTERKMSYRDVLMENATSDAEVRRLESATSEDEDYDDEEETYEEDQSPLFEKIDANEESVIMLDDSVIICDEQPGNLDLRVTRGSLRRKESSDEVVILKEITSSNNNENASGKIRKTKACVLKPTLKKNKKRIKGKTQIVYNQESSTASV